MPRISAERKLEKYFQIYTQIYENPLISRNRIAQNLKMAPHTVTNYLQEMKDSFMFGPAIYLKPAQNYHEYVYFLNFENPLSACALLEQHPSVITINLAFGRWNLFFIADEQIDYANVEGYQECILHGVKSVTFLSRVTTLDWDQSMENMRSMVKAPQQRSSLYKEGPAIPWKEWEWALYHKLKHNVRIPVNPVLEELDISSEQYKKWASSLFDVTSIQSAFFPSGKNRTCDFLFQSENQKQLTDILGQLPSSWIFFSVGDYLFGGFCTSTSERRRELHKFTYEMRGEGLFSELRYAEV